MNEAAEKLKGEANDFFKNKDYIRAIEKYSGAIIECPDQPVLFSNRSIAHLKSESPGAALNDANTGTFYFHFKKILFKKIIITQAFFSLFFY